MIKEQLPPDAFSVEIISYFQRMNLNVENAIAEVLNIIPVRDRPEQPLEGVLYYLQADVPDTIITKGYWYWTTDAESEGGGFWEKLAVGSEVTDLQTQISELEERITLLENP